MTPMLTPRATPRRRVALLAAVLLLVGPLLTVASRPAQAALPNDEVDIAVISPA